LTVFLRRAGRAAILRYEELVADPVQLLRAAGLKHGASPSIGIIEPMRPAPTDDNGLICLAERIRQLVATGELRAIARFYPDYLLRPKASRN
jgi:hypothetical protein